MLQEKDKQILGFIVRRLRRYLKTVDEPLVEKAFIYAKEAHKNQLRKSGDPYFDHPLEVAKILTELKMDYITVAGGFLHDVVEDTGITVDEVSDEFGAEVALLVDGVTKISELKFDSVEERQAENFRKMILSMVKDIRVILIKFADRLHNMRTLHYLPEKKQRRIAIETRDVYAPLAHRLGIAKVKWELEDLALKVLKPDVYWNLSKSVADSREKREAYIRSVTIPIRKELKNANIRAKITGRPKHLYSIQQKIEVRQKTFEEIYDLLAIRIIVKKMEDCYFALGLVHSLFTPVQERFKDYVATPKSNMYQSLHTTVISNEGKKVEVQIRTEEMHRTAEEGIAAHWRYKEGKTRADDLDKHLNWLREVLDWQHDTQDPVEFMENLRIDLFHDEVFVFTPRGDLFKLALGSTPVDFAFAVHTDIGLHCIGAKVNGKIVPLNYQLKSGDSVEILTSANQNPNPGWMKFTKTSKARSKIKRWLRESLFDESLKLGEELLHKKLKKYNLKYDDKSIQDISLSYGFEDIRQFFAALGSGDISMQSLRKKIVPEEKDAIPDDSLLQKFISRARRSAKGVRIQGIDNLLFTFAKCCQPIPGDNIIGFISRGNGVMIHRTDCKNLTYLMESPERKIDVEWDVDKDKHFIARIRILAEDRKDYLRDISETISVANTNIISINMKSEDHVVNSNLIIEVRNLSHLTMVIKKINKVKGVISVERLNGSGETVNY
ncbi:MAG: bifunctional (p)ppGpp synthetase/guanosine-3',5'-bis(diphosphate) 3'-pyrophosphohydrolase [Calditrichaeota bacterium]|nr:MAG: bifunctional (p)ppGpp synthetase/guanosine-3',5'-bis(diphosphate) 3'-pyrophosphohydrolase [Calditrichota bacterium]